MVHKSKLLAALDVHQGRNHEVEKQKKYRKQAEKRAKSNNATTEELEDKGDSGGVALLPLEEAPAKVYQTHEIILRLN